MVLEWSLKDLLFLKRLADAEKHGPSIAKYFLNMRQKMEAAQEIFDIEGFCFGVTEGDSLGGPEHFFLAEFTSEGQVITKTVLHKIDFTALAVTRQVVQTWHRPPCSILEGMMDAMVDGAAECSPTGEAYKRSSALIESYHQNSPLPWDLPGGLPEVDKGLQEFVESIAEERWKNDSTDIWTNFQGDNE